MSYNLLSATFAPALIALVGLTATPAAAAGEGPVAQGRAVTQLVRAHHRGHHSTQHRPGHHQHRPSA